MASPKRHRGLARRIDPKTLENLRSGRHKGGVEAEYGRMLRETGVVALVLNPQDRHHQVRPGDLLMEERLGPVGVQAGLKVFAPVPPLKGHRLRAQHLVGVSEGPRKERPLFDHVVRRHQKDGQVPKALRHRCGSCRSSDRTTPVLC